MPTRLRADIETPGLYLYLKDMSNVGEVEFDPVAGDADALRRGLNLATHGHAVAESLEHEIDAVIRYGNSLAEIAIRQYLQRTYIRSAGSRIELLCFQGPANSH